MTLKIIERLSNGRFAYRTDIHHVTELSGCLKQAHLERKHAHPVTIKEVMKKAHGSAVHRHMFGFDRWSELPIRMTVEFEDKTIAVAGYIDHFDPEKKIIVDLKSTSFLKWQYQNGMLPRKRDELQVQSYYSIWTGVYGFPAEELRLIYIDDESSPRTFEVERRDLTEWLRTRAIRLHKSMLADSPPEGEPNPLCRFCPFKSSCNGD